MKIAIVGFGIEGRASYEYWNHDDNTITIVDERDKIDALPDGVETILGEGAFAKLNSFDLIIRSPSVPPSKLPYGDKVWSATNEFFKKCPSPIIGVTGTKGKGTTCSLITSILKKAGRDVHLVGNIGDPALSVLDQLTTDSIVVYELSSFQLWDLQSSPHTAVLLGIEADHLDVHADMDEYVSAKAHITMHQTSDDVLIYNQSNAYSQRIASKSRATTHGYMKSEIIGAYANSLSIPGRHNAENAAAAVLAVNEYVSDNKIISEGLRVFTGLPHRIKFVREHKGVRYYDDSYSSAPAASIAALRSFNAPKIIILGGYEKNADFRDLANYLSSESSVKKAVLIGDTRHRIKSVFEACHVPESRYELLDTTRLLDIVNRAASIAISGDVVLLSPACASFDMFKNFTDRGEQFTRLVNEIS